MARYKKALRQNYVLLIDGKNFVWRACAVQKHIPVVNPDNAKDVTAIYNGARMIKNLIDCWEPDAMFIIWEGDVPSSKRQILPEYKTFRHIQRARDEYMQQFNARVQASIPMFKELCEYCGVINVDFPDCEADDIIAGLIYDKEFLPEFRRIIISTDRDFLHLVDESCLCLQRKYELLVNKDNYGTMAKEIYKIPDEALFPWEGHLFYQSIVGDKSDDVAGALKGIGPVKAARIVHDVWMNIGPERLRDFDEVRGALLKMPLDKVNSSIKNKIRELGENSSLLAFNWMFFDPYTWIEDYVADLIINHTFEPAIPDYDKFAEFCHSITLTPYQLYQKVFEGQLKRTNESID